MNTVMQGIEEKAKQGFTLLEHIGQIGARKINPLADNLGAMVDAFAPGVGDTVAKVIKEIALAEQNAVDAGQQEGSGPEKLAKVLQSVSSDVAAALRKNRKVSSKSAINEAGVTAVNSAVAALNGVQIPGPFESGVEESTEQAPPSDLSEVYETGSQERDPEKS